MLLKKITINFSQTTTKETFQVILKKVKILKICFKLKNLTLNIKLKVFL